jgi:hypothetical protein
MQGGFLGQAWRWVQEQLLAASQLGEDLFRQPPSAATGSARGLRGLLALA